MQFANPSFEELLNCEDASAARVLYYDAHVEPLEFACIVDVLTMTTMPRDERIRETVKRVAGLGAFKTLAGRTQLVAKVNDLFNDPDEITGGVNTPTFMHALQMLETLAQSSLDYEEGAVCVKSKDVDSYITRLFRK